MDVVLKELETLIYIPVSQYKGDVSGNNNIQFPVKPTTQSSQNCQNLNRTQFQMTYSSQVLQGNMTVSVAPMSLFHTSHYFRLLFTRFFHYWDHLIPSFMLNTTIDLHRQVYDENFSWGLHVRSAGCLTCHALRMWSYAAHDVHSISPSHLSCHPLLYCPIKQTSQEIKKMPLKLPQLAKVQCQSQRCHKLLQFQCTTQYK